MNRVLRYIHINQANKSKDLLNKIKRIFSLLCIKFIIKSKNLTNKKFYNLLLRVRYTVIYTLKIMNT